MSKSIIIVGTGNAAMCAAIAALEGGATVVMLEKADENLAGGNTKYTAGAMRFAYDGNADLLPLVRDQNDPRLSVVGWGRPHIHDCCGGNCIRSCAAQQQVVALLRQI